MSYSINFRRNVLSVREKEGLSIRKIDKSALEKDVELYPDAYQKERAERFGRDSDLLIMVDGHIPSDDLVVHRF